MVVAPAFLSPNPIPYLTRKASKCTTNICCSSAETNFQKITQFSKRRNFRLLDQCTGPILNLRLTDEASGKDLGYLTGALLPNRLHIESYKAQPRVSDGGLLAVSPGMLLFITALAHASQRRIPSVYGLAIDDAPTQHRRLVAYLKRFGGEKVMRINDDLKSVPARMFYGGFGTVIRGDVEKMLKRGMRMLDYEIERVSKQ